MARTNGAGITVRYCVLAIVLQLCLRLSKQGRSLYGKNKSCFSLQASLLRSRKECLWLLLQGWIGKENPKKIACNFLALLLISKVYE
jgi:hypothetical protein